MKKYLGLDLSVTGTGLVVLDAEGAVLRAEVFGYELTRSASPRDKIERLISIALRIVDIVRSESVTQEGEEEVEWEAAIEHYAYRQHGAVADLGELNGVVKTQLWLAHQIIPRAMAVNSARKSVLGRGNFKKDQVIPLLQGRGLTFTDHNVADAYVIAEALRRRKDDGSEEQSGPRRARKRRASGGGRRARGNPQTSLGFAG